MLPENKQYSYDNIDIDLKKNQFFKCIFNSSHLIKDNNSSWDEAFL